MIPAESQIAQLVGDIRRWRREDNDWQTTRQRIDDNYGYHKYPSNCHIIPNHALMIMAILYAPDDFQQAQCIVNTSGWDTDCNAGNVGCLSGIMLGPVVLTQARLARAAGGQNADLLSRRGFSINNAVRITDYLVGLGHQIAGLPRPEAKNPARSTISHYRAACRVSAGLMKKMRPRLRLRMRRTWGGRC